MKEKITNPLEFELNEKEKMIEEVRRLLGEPSLKLEEKELLEETLKKLKGAKVELLSILSRDQIEMLVRIFEAHSAKVPAIFKK